MDYTVDAIVIGAGAIGLAVGRALAIRGLETIVLERANGIGSESSSRNSEVIHAGIYYPPESLKAKYCVRGKDLLYDYLKARNIPYSRCGKLIVSQLADEDEALKAIASKGRQCGVIDLEMLSRDEVNTLEPRVEASSGLFSPSTGIFDSHQFMLSLQGDLEAAGGIVALSSPVSAGSLSRQDRHTVLVAGEPPTRVGCRILINASGLWARDTWLTLARKAESALIPPQYFAKGHYYSYSGTSPFSHLVYPLPEAGGLGVHATLDLAGQVRFGPDVRWTANRSYEFDDSQREHFATAIRKYFPTLEVDRLVPAYTGIRAKITGPEATSGDFMICTEKMHGFPGFVSLHGIESPGLTASLAIAEAVARKV